MLLFSTLILTLPFHFDIWGRGCVWHTWSGVKLQVSSYIRHAFVFGATKVSEKKNFFIFYLSGLFFALKKCMGRVLGGCPTVLNQLY